MMIAASNLCASHCLELGESDSIKNYIFRDIIRSVIVNTVFEKNMRHFLFFPESRYIFENFFFGENVHKLHSARNFDEIFEISAFSAREQNISSRKMSRYIFWQIIFGKMFTNCIPLEISTKYSKFLAECNLWTFFQKYIPIFFGKYFVRGLKMQKFRIFRRNF